MFNKNNTRLWWIIMIICLSSILGAFTLTNWGSIWAIISGVIALGIVIWQIVMWRINQHKKKIVFKLMDMGFKPVTDIVETTSNSETKIAEKVLSFKLDTHVELISVFFQGIGKIPEIRDLHDIHIVQDNRRPKNVTVNPLGGFNDGRWEWHYNPPHHRVVGSSITICIDYLATDCFVGNLIFELTADDPGVRKRQSVAVHITENKEK